MKIPFYHIDAFTSKLFSGNPALICVLDHWLPADQLQAIANENSLPATAFLVKSDGEYQTRWFAPEYEIALCGHGSLASGYVIFNVLEPSRRSVFLTYPSGILELSHSGDAIHLSLPIKNIESFDSALIMEGLGAKPKAIYQHKTERCLVLFETEEEVRNLKPDMSILKKLDHIGIVVTARSQQFDFISRTFYPNKRFSEDPVTGSSHCLLVPYWAKILNKNKLHAYQASHRGGEIYCELQEENIVISGNAVLYSQGMIHCLASD